MRISCTKNDLVESTNIVIKAVSVKTTMPILSCILIDASADIIKMTANDMELAIETKLEGRIIEPGVIAVDARLFSEIIKKLPDGVVTIKDNQGKIRIECEKAAFEIIGKEAEEFVRMPSVETKEYICVSEFTLKEMIRKTIFSIAQNENNKIMTGELFEVSGNSLKVVSLDGHRISINNVMLRETYQDHKVIVPGKTLNEISRIIPGDSERDVYIFFTNNYILFEFRDTIVLSRIIEGDYFKIERMINNDYETKISVDKKALLDAIERSLLLIRETDKRPIILKINSEGLNISMNTVIGAMREEMDIAREGKDITIGFNPKFLSDALRAIDDETIDIYMINAKSPCIIRDEASSYIYLILPINFAA